MIFLLNFPHHDVIMTPPVLACRIFISPLFFLGRALPNHYLIVHGAASVDVSRQLNDLSPVICDSPHMFQDDGATNTTHDTTIQ